MLKADMCCDSFILREMQHLGRNISAQTNASHSASYANSIRSSNAELPTDSKALKADDKPEEPRRRPLVVLCTSAVSKHSIGSQF